MAFIVRDTVTRTFLDRILATPEAVGFFRRVHGCWEPLTFLEFYQRCELLSLGLMARGIGKGDKVALLSGTRLEWSLLDMAILGAGAVTVPIYPSSTPAEVEHILANSETLLVFAEDDRQRAKIPASIPIVMIDSLEELAVKGAELRVHYPERFRRNLEAAAPDDLISICYTSGTSGVPKGVMLTHDNMMSVLEDCRTLVVSITTKEGESVLSFLPFSHILGKVESMSVYTFGFRQYFAQSIDTLDRDLREARPTLLFAVPRLFEKAHARIEAAVDAAGPRKRSLFNWALAAGRARASSGRLSARYALARLLVFRKVSSRLGGRLRYVICGGAPLGKELGEYFEALGIQILEGYGLTETCAPVAINRPGEIRFGTVGRPLPEVSVRIAEDGEILIRSRKLFRGYYKMPEETAAAFTQGWFRTGDVGHLDDDGYLRITDRKKDLIITSGGKNVAPQKIENLMKADPLIAECAVYGDRRHYLTAVLSLDPAALRDLAISRGIPATDPAVLCARPEIIAAVDERVKRCNARLASYETIKKFLLVPEEFSIENGALTPSQKLRRAVVHERYRARLEALYS